MISVVKNQFNDGTCGICLENIIDDDCANIPCGHSFHTCCIVQNKTNKCPKCQYIMYGDINNSNLKINIEAAKRRIIEAKQKFERERFEIEKRYQAYENESIKKLEAKIARIRNHKSTM